MVDKPREVFVIDTKEMLASTMDKGNHKVQGTDLIRMIKNKVARLVSTSTGMAGNNDLIILDISYWQDDALIDYEELSKHIDGVILRATYAIWEDTRFNIHYHNFKKYNVPMGAYAYIIGNHTGRAQAKVFAEVVSGHDLKMGYWTDVEDTRPVTGLSRSVVDDFVVNGDRLVGKLMDFYTGPYVWQTIMRGGGYGDRKLWIANYGVMSPMLPKGGDWREWWMWQFTSKGRHPGYRSDLDTNRFFHSKETFLNWVGKTEAPIEEPPSGEPLFRAQCIVDGLYVRSCPRVADECTIVGGLTKHSDPVEVYEVASNGWFKLGENEWCSGDPLYMKILVDETPEPPEPPTPETWEEAYELLEGRIKNAEKEIDEVQKIIEEMKRL